MESDARTRGGTSVERQCPAEYHCCGLWSAKTNSEGPPKAAVTVNVCKAQFVPGSRSQARRERGLSPTTATDMPIITWYYPYSCPSEGMASLCSSLIRCPSAHFTLLSRQTDRLFVSLCQQHESMLICITSSTTDSLAAMAALPSSSLLSSVPSASSSWRLVDNPRVLRGQPQFRRLLTPDGR